MSCPCGKGSSYETCCGPFISGEKKPATAEDLMRSRYTAYVNGDMKYIKNTLAAEKKREFDMASAQEWSAKSKWLGLEILSAKKGGESDSKGTIEFIAKYAVGGKTIDHHEVAEFRKDAGQWYFVDGDSHVHEDGQGHHHHHEPQAPVVREGPKIGRNDPCTCGSGKKYKKCCGTAA